MANLSDAHVAEMKDSKNWMGDSNSHRGTKENTKKNNPKDAQCSKKAALIQGGIIITDVIARMWETELSSKQGDSWGDKEKYFSTASKPV